MKQKALVLHTKISGEIALSVFIGSKRAAEIPMGTSAPQARKTAEAFIQAVKDADGYDDKIT